MKKIYSNKILLLLLLFSTCQIFSQKKRVRDYGIEIGVFKTGLNNSITDVDGVKVGHTTLFSGDDVRTGVTAIIPHTGNIYQQKVPAAIYIANGYGKLAGFSQVKELGNIETPIILTNTLAVPTAFNALINYTLNQKGNENVQSVNAVVGETNDSFLNNIRSKPITENDVLKAIENAKSGIIEEGNVGAGTGTTAFQYKGGIGTSSRVIPKKLGGYTVGVLVQTNFGGVLEINGVPIAKEMDNFAKLFKYDVDGSCMIVVMTDAPLSSRNLERLAKRAILGLAKTGGIASNGSGDFVIAASTYKDNFIMGDNQSMFIETKELDNNAISPLFLAVIEATEEAIINSLFAASTTVGFKGNQSEALPIPEVLKIMKKYNALKNKK